MQPCQRQQQSTEFLAGEHDLRCGYAGKRCPNWRTDKKGGGLHRFCEFHRLRANRNQWRVDNKRRALRAHRRQQLKRLHNGSAPTATPMPTPTSPSGPTLPDPVDLCEDLEPMPLEDIEVLSAMLLGDMGWESHAGATVASSLSQQSLMPYEFVV